MNDETLRQMLRVAGRTPAAEAAMPFGFDTRVLAALRATPEAPDFIRPLARRTAILALGVILLAGFGWYQTISDDDYSSAYAMADTVIERNISR